MKILFFLEKSHLRHFPEVLAELKRRKHSVMLVTEQPKEADPSFKELEHKLKFRTSILDMGKRGDWYGIANSLRWTRNQIFFLHSRFDGSPYLQSRSAHLSDPAFDFILKTRNPIALRLLDRLLARLDEALPLPRSVLHLMEKHEPDLILVSPLLFPAHVHQYDYLRSAKHLGIPACFPVFSWDNLTTKGALLHAPDRTLVWNETQLRELVELHGIPAQTVEVVGAYRFLSFLDLTPSTSREEYLSRLGLDPKKPTILYLGSSELCAPGEAEFCREWLQEIRREIDANVLIRPHPRHCQGFTAEKFAGFGPVALLLPENMPDTKSQELFDMLFFSKAVVGINTSGMLEAAALGVPVYSLRTERTRNFHARTVHFKYLLDLIQMASSHAEHRQQLKKRLAQGGDDAQTRAFAKAFLGLEGKSPVVRFADCVEDLRENYRAVRPEKRLSDRLLQTAMRFHLPPLRRLGVGQETIEALNRIITGVKAP